MTVARSFRLRRLALAGLALALAGCAETRWENPNLPVERWREDQASCRREAAGQVATESAREALARGDATMSRSFEADMARFDVQRRERALFTQCMRAKGYAQVEIKTGD